MREVLLFTDEAVVAAGVKCVLNRPNGFHVAGVSDKPATLLETAMRLKPDLLLVDMTPEITFGILVEFRKRMPECRIIMWVRSIATELAYQAIEHGVSGILRKTLPEEALLKCLRMVAEGGLWFEDSLREGFTAARAVTLSRREAELVSLLSHGLKNKEIAASLRISEGTVKVYLSRLFRKLEVKDRFELALFGLKNVSRAEHPIRHRANGAGRRGKVALGSSWLRSLLLEGPGARARGAVG